MKIIVLIHTIQISLLLNKVFLALTTQNQKIQNQNQNNENINI